MTLTLALLLGIMSDNFCQYREQGVDTVKAVALSLSHVQDKYGGSEVRRIIKESNGLAPLAIGAAGLKCPALLP